MTPKRIQLILSITVGFILLAALVFVASVQEIPQARADTVPTPVAIMNQSPESALITFVDNYSTTDGAGDTSIQLYTFEYCNLQYVVDQPATGAPNTTTLTVEWSMDDSTWSSGPALVSANVADADSIVQVPNLGRYMRVYEDHTLATPITITVKGVCK